MTILALLLFLTLFVAVVLVLQFSRRLHRPNVSDARDGGLEYSPHPRNRPYLWTCWTGTNEMPAYLQMCFRIIQNFNADAFECVCVSPHNLASFLFDMHPAYGNLSYVNKANYLRCMLLHQYGGVYLDMDTLCFAPLRDVIQILLKNEIVGYDESPWGEIWGVSIMMNQKNTLYTREWKKALHAVLDAKQHSLAEYRRNHMHDLHKDSLQWAEIITDIVLPLSQTIKKDKKLAYHILPQSIIAASDENEVVENRNKITRSASVILNNGLYKNNIKKSSLEDIESNHENILLFSSLKDAMRLSEAFLSGKLASNIEVCFIINLDHRTDRWADISAFVKETFLNLSNVHRLPAVYTPTNGALGCLMSHISVLRRAKAEHPHHNVLVLEDDVQATSEPFQESIERFFSTPQLAANWDVLMLACNVLEDRKIFHTSDVPVREIKEGLTTSAYLVRAGYVGTLLAVFEECLQKGKVSWKESYCTDRCWIPLQKRDRWYNFSPALLRQAPSYSDIEKKMVDYRV